jgi:hypothetical protein
MLDPSYYISHPANSDQQEIQRALAREFLRDIEKEARRKGGRPGNPPKAHQNKRMVAVLSTLANGGSLKQFAEEETRLTDTTPEERVRALRLQLLKWCKRIYGAMIDEYTFLSHVKSANDAMIRHALQHWPGVEFPRDVKAFRYAIQQHLQSGNTIPK